MCAGLTCEELILVKLVLAVMLGPDTLVMCLIKWLVVSPGGWPLFFVAFLGLPLAEAALHTTQASECAHHVAGDSSGSGMYRTRPCVASILLMRARQRLHMVGGCMSSLSSSIFMS